MWCVIQVVDVTGAPFAKTRMSQSKFSAFQGKLWKGITAGPVARNEALRAAKYLGWAIWRNWSGYHRRSRTKTKMRCMKLLGQRLMARDFDRQVAEVQIRIAVMNGYTALGIPLTEVVR